MTAVAAIATSATFVVRRDSHDPSFDRLACIPSSYRHVGSRKPKVLAGASTAHAMVVVGISQLDRASLSGACFHAGVGRCHPCGGNDCDHHDSAASGSGRRRDPGYLSYVFRLHSGSCAAPVADRKNGESERQLVVTFTPPLQGRGRGWGLSTSDSVRGESPPQPLPEGKGLEPVR